MTVGYEGGNAMKGGRRVKRTLFVVLAACFPTYALGVGSGGFTNQVVGSKALGMGNAFVATADDPSAVYFNPAGLVQIESPSLSIGTTLIDSNSEFTSPNGSQISRKSETPIIPNFYAVAPLERGRITIGLGAYSPFGLGTEWPKDSPFRYVATRSDLATFQLNPTLTYAVHEKASIAAGIVYARTNATLESQLNVSGINTIINGGPTLSPDGERELSGSGDGWGYNVAVHIRPSGNHAIGVSYRSRVNTEVEGDAKLRGLSGSAALLFGGTDYTTEAETDVEYPQSLLLGYAYKPGKWTFEVDGEWVGYGTIDDQNIKIVGESNPTRLAFLNSGNPANRDWHNSWNLGLGVNYEFNKTWQSRAGYFYYPRVVPTATWEPSNPESSRNGFTLGGTFQRDSFTVDLAYNFVRFNDRQIANDIGAQVGSSVDGRYETDAHIFSTNFTYRFADPN